MKNISNQKKKESKAEAEGENSHDLKQQAIKYKAFRHSFSERDVKDGIDSRVVAHKIKKSKIIEESYLQYLKELEKNPNKKMSFPWDSLSKRAAIWTSFWAPRFLRWGGLIGLVALIINYMPGPTQHIIEYIFARALYDTAPIERLPEQLETYAHSASIVDKQGAVIKSYGQRQATLSIPDKVRKAVLACEDHYLLPHPRYPWYVNSFIIHPGVSWINLAGAARDWFFDKPRGASTIVMQNAKKILANDKRSLANKIEEIILAYMMVAKFGKETNLDFYINTVPVGANIYGFQAAAANYFKKDLRELTMQQLVAIGSFIPNHHRQAAFYKIMHGQNFAELGQTHRNHAMAAMNKINLALDHLRSLGEITPEEYDNWILRDENSIRKIGFRAFRSPLYGEEEWTSWNVIKEICSRKYRVGGRILSGEELILDARGDVVIETGVDLELVEKIKEFIKEFLASNDYVEVLRQANRNTWQKDHDLYKNKGITPPYKDFQGFMDYLRQNINVGIMMMNRMGEIIAYVGGKEFLQNGNVEEVGIASKKMPGQEEEIIIDLLNKKATITPSSTMKPLVSYYAMLAGNAKLDSLFVDKPIEYKYVESEGREIWLPRNWYAYDGQGAGNNRFLGKKYSLLEAQVTSVNTIFARLYSEQPIRDALLFRLDEIGLDYNREEAKYWPFGIGATEIPAQQWLGVYNAFLDGLYRPPAFVKRITVNGRTIYERHADSQPQPLPLFDSKKEREAEMTALYEVCNRGTGAQMKSEFRYHRNLVSGKTGTAPHSRSSLFMGHFNPYLNRGANSDNTMSFLATVTTNSGGHKSVGFSSTGPVKVMGKTLNYLFDKELRRMLDEKIDNAKKTSTHFRNNHLYWAHVNRYVEELLQGRCRNGAFIHESVGGIDGYSEAIDQILNDSGKIYSGRDELFNKLVDYYCDQAKVVRLAPAEEISE